MQLKRVSPTVAVALAIAGALTGGWLFGGWAELLGGAALGAVIGLLLDEVRAQHVH